ncbi:conserved hypothetical protein, partial [Ricinus communis]
MADTGDFNAYWLFLVGLRYPQYPEHGGNVAIAAGHDVKFAKTDYFFTDWLARIGGKVTIDTAGTSNPPTYELTTWGVLLDDLANQQGVAAMGGGNLAVTAGNDIANLYATLPVTARQNGGGTRNQVEIVGGGNATVIAGRDILSPRIQVDKGELNLTAGRNITAATSNDLNAVLAIADTQVNLHARGDIIVDAIVNSTVLPLAAAQNNGGLLPSNYFFTYSDKASVTAQSLGGDVLLANRAKKVDTAFAARYATDLFRSSSLRFFEIYPGTVRLQALQGDVKFANDMMLFPTAKGQLEVNAANNVASTGDATASIVLSDADVASLGTLAAPRTGQDVDAALEAAMKQINPQHATQPVHRDDNTAAIIDALNGDIAPQFALPGTLRFQFTINKSLLAHAGRDLINTDFYIQHSRDSDISELLA